MSSEKSQEQQLFDTFVEEAMISLDEWEASLLKLDENKTDQNENTIKSLFRTAHNLKGSARSVGLEDFSDIVHHCEDLIRHLQKSGIIVEKSAVTILLNAEAVLRSELARLMGKTYEAVDTGELLRTIDAYIGENRGGRPSSGSSMEIWDDDSQSTQNNSIGSTQSVQEKGQYQSSEVIRVNLDRLDHLIKMINSIDEVVASQISQLSGATSQAREVNHSSSPNVSAKLLKSVAEARNAAMSLRMLPLTQIFSKMKRTIRDASSLVGKAVKVNLEGEWVELDKTIVDALASPLTHLVRNAVDHGIEEQEAMRIANGKAKHGTITLRAEHKDDYVQLTIEDDGGGINPDIIWQKMIDKELIKPDEPRWDEDRILAMIFTPGFSTKKEVSELSGRGIGLDVVHESITHLNGSVRIDSRLNQGTAFIINLPLSLSIISGLVISIRGEKYVVPISQLESTLSLSQIEILRSGNKARMVEIRGNVMPLISLENRLELGQEDAISSKSDKVAIVINDSGSRIAFEVDAIVGQQTMVLKPLTDELVERDEFMAGAILKDGYPTLVLDLVNFRESWKFKQAS